LFFASSVTSQDGKRELMSLRGGRRCWWRDGEKGEVWEKVADRVEVEGKREGMATSVGVVGGGGLGVGG
jgi:hypothetical protein